MNEQERKVVLEQLDASRERILGLVDGLTVEQWTFRTGADRWSISECLEHVMVLENRVNGLMGKVLDGPDDVEKKGQMEGEREGKDAMIMRIVPDRSVPIQAPEPVRPVAQWPDPAELVAQFEAARLRTTRFAVETQRDLRSHFIMHPVLGELDCYQWLLALSLHGERHARQMEEVKAAETFPAGELTLS